MAKTRLSILIVAGLSSACAAQTSEESNKPTGASGGNSAIIATGSGNPTAANNSLPDASSTADGTMQISAEKAAEALEDPQAACQGWSVEAEADGSTILFLVDVSGSMLDTAPSTGGKSKWEVTRTALKEAISHLPNTTGIGISFFPNMEIISETKSSRPVSACVDTSRDVPVAAGTAKQQTAVLDALDRISPYQKAATPTHDAVTLALDQLKKTTIGGKRYLVFITDGQPTQSQGCLGTGIMCTPSPVEPILDTISNAYSEAQINTFVVGSPGSERNYCTDADVRDWLSKAARVGNTASPSCNDNAAPYCHFDLSTASDFGVAMTEALSKISKSIVSCNYSVPSSTTGTVLDPNRVNMIYNNGKGGYYLLLPNRGADCTKGWNYTDGSNTMVQICGDTCTLLQENPAAKLSILFGCKSGDTVLIL